MNEIGAGALCPYCNGLLDARSTYCSSCGAALRGTQLPIPAHTGTVLPAPTAYAAQPPYPPSSHYPGPAMPPSSAYAQPAPAYSQAPHLYSQPAPAPWTPMPQVAYPAQAMPTAQPMMASPAAVAPPVVIVNAGQPTPSAAPQVLMISNERHDGLNVVCGAMALFLGGLSVAVVCGLLLLLALAAR